jgi:iron complex transport system permease protein
VRDLTLNFALAAGLLALVAAGLLLGETPLTAAQYAQAFADPASGAHEVVFAIRLPRTVCAAVVGVLLTAIAARFREPETLILFGVALSAFCGAVTSLVFNFAPSPVTLAEVFAWLLGSVQNRDWADIGRALPPMAIGAGLCLYAARGLVMLTLGEETAALSGLPMQRLRTAAVAGASLLTGAAVAVAGIVGFVGLAAPHLVRAGAGADPGRILAPSALAGAALLVAADLAARLIPTDLELKLGVVTALFGAPLFALIAWRAARSWRG